MEMKQPLSFVMVGIETKQPPLFETTDGGETKQPPSFVGNGVETKQPQNTPIK